MGGWTDEEAGNDVLWGAVPLSKRRKVDARGVLYYAGCLPRGDIVAGVYCFSPHVQGVVVRLT